MIMQINFYHYGERLVYVGYNDAYVDMFGERREVFEIAEDEQLIGCQLHKYKLDNGLIHFAGVTWLKMKLTI